MAVSFGAETGKANDEKMKVTIPHRHDVSARILMQLFRSGRNYCSKDLHWAMKVSISITYDKPFAISCSFEGFCVGE